MWPEQSLHKLLEYCRANGWTGYDPYDGLKSPVSSLIPHRWRLARTFLTQVVKRSPINVRPMLGIRKGLNPKGVALAASALLKLQGQCPRDRTPAGVPARGASQGIGCEELEEDIRFLLESLAALRCSGYDESCWGYNFDWQSRAFYAPRGTPNVVCTVFAANAFLDRHDRSPCDLDFETADGSCRFLLDHINRTEEAGGHCFGYTPVDRSRIHNVNLLAAELLARVYRINGKPEYSDAAEKAVAYTLARQRRDGSWPYGEATQHQWIDSFHTGFILVSLKRIMEYLGEKSWSENLRRGYEFYKKNFFLADFAPKYYHKKALPLDVHSAAVAIVTFVEMSDLMPDAREMADGSMRWALENMQDSAGFFYYQRRRFYTIRIPYMRWAQAWMLCAISAYLAGNRGTQWQKMQQP